MYHFTLFAMFGVEVHLFVDLEEPQEEGRIIVKMLDPKGRSGMDDTLFYRNYVGQVEKEKFISAALIAAANALEA